MDTPLVSVIMPTFNRTDYIGEAISSVLAQDWGDIVYELIIIDDGSTDDTSEVVARFNMSNLSYLKGDNSGHPSIPRNRGIALARGTYLAFLDSDDRWHTGKIRHQLAHLDETGAAMTYANASVIDQAGSVTAATYINPTEIDRGEDPVSLVAANVIPTSSVLVRTAVVHAAGGFNEAKGFKGVEDYDLWLRIVATNLVVACSGVLIDYRVHKDNFSYADEYSSYQQLLKAYASALLGASDARYRQALHSRMYGLHRASVRLAKDGRLRHISAAGLHRLQARFNWWP